MLPKNAFRKHHNMRSRVRRRPYVALLIVLCTCLGVESWLGSFFIAQTSRRDRLTTHGFATVKNGDVKRASRDDASARSTSDTKQVGTKKKQKKPPNKLQPWRIFGVEVHPDDLQLDIAQERKATDPQQLFLHPAVVTALTKRLKTTDYKNARVVRRSLDARMKRRTDGSVGPRFVYVMDVDTKARLKPQPGRTEVISTSKEQPLLPKRNNIPPDKRVIIVGAGPAGLFAALQLARQGIKPILLERGQPVERRGKDIGALMHRRSLDAESNFCFGEGGAGTWSDGKLTTRIGRNSNAVRHVLETFVEFGAPQNILLEGAPHLGTDNLVRLLRNMRSHLRDLGGEIRFGTKMTDLIIKDGAVLGVEYDAVASEERAETGLTSQPFETRGTILGDAVIVATGHSARDVYERLHEAGAQLEPKGFAVGFRIEHPQKVINQIQYGNEWGPTVITGKAPTDLANTGHFVKSDMLHTGVLPVPSYRLATDEAFDGERNRGVYSFCMCPGGQIVPASTEPDEICVNGMSFSRRDSQWANSALVVTVAPEDAVLEPYREAYGILAGIAFQRDMERRASVMGGGNLTVPVQRVTDFIKGQASTSTASSSYRLGTKPAACHEIYPACLSAALRHALVNRFDEQMPGYVCDDAILHAVETRTSSPVRITRNETNLKAVGIDNLFPAGEGAGFAGGIVSAAVDGMVVAEAVVDSLSGNLREGNSQRHSSAADSFY